MSGPATAIAIHLTYWRIAHFFFPCFTMTPPSPDRFLFRLPIHYKRLTAKSGAKYIAPDGVQHGATTARGTVPSQLRTKSLRKKLHDHRHSQPCFLPEHCIKELVFMDSMINPKPGEGERGTNLGGSTPNEG